MQVQAAVVGAKGFDSLPLCSASGAAADTYIANLVKNAGMKFFVGYLGVTSPQLVAKLLASGVAFMPCTFADHFDGPTAVSQLKALGMPAGVTVWLDLEGLGAATDIPGLIAKINAWASAVQAVGYEAGLYVGSQTLLTSAELMKLKVTRYWASASMILDRNGLLAMPACGWCMHQLFPSVVDQGVLVDYDFVRQDFQGRLPHWVVA